MRVGIPKETKNHEYRVGMTPSSVREMVRHGHHVLVETGAGTGIGADDAQYRNAGATVCQTAAEIFAESDMIVKVKEPQAGERAMLREGQILYTYLHLAPDPEQCNDLIKSGAVCIAYETVTQPGGGLPLLAPMSEVAGRMSIQAGATCLEKSHGGMGMLLGGVPGVERAKIVILGGGVAGTNAAQMAVGTGADVVVIDRNVDVLRRIDRTLGARVVTLFSNGDNIEHHVLSADLVIGCVLIPGAAAPKLITKEMVSGMKAGAVIVDIAIDQGGCCETAKPTTHACPTYVVDRIVHYCVANIPGAVARTSTYALNNATLPYALQVADKGWKQALKDDDHLANGLNIAFGKVTCREVAESLERTYCPASRVLQH
jgi:alanine dehydrogenase